MNDSGETNLQGRTGSVSSRWWETPAEPTAPLPPPAPLPPVESVGGRSRFAPPPPPPPAWLNVGPDQATADAAAVHRLERELAAALEEVAAARDEVGALHEMLEDLPAIFERKFRQRLQGILEQQQLLLADNQAMRERLYALSPAQEPDQAVRPARPLLQAALPALPEQPRIRQTLRRIFERARGTVRLNDRDDGRTTAASAGPTRR
jgi:hypothetical protein